MHNRDPYAHGYLDYLNLFALTQFYNLILNLIQMSINLFIVFFSNFKLKFGGRFADRSRLAEHKIVWHPFQNFLSQLRVIRS